LKDLSPDSIFEFANRIAKDQDYAIDHITRQKRYYSNNPQVKCD